MSTDPLGFLAIVGAILSLLRFRARVKASRIDPHAEVRAIRQMLAEGIARLDLEGERAKQVQERFAEIDERFTDILAHWEAVDKAARSSEPGTAPSDNRGPIKENGGVGEAG